MWNMRRHLDNNWNWKLGVMQFFLGKCWYMIVKADTWLCVHVLPNACIPIVDDNSKHLFYVMRATIFPEEWCNLHIGSTPKFWNQIRKKCCLYVGFYGICFLSSNEIIYTITTLQSLNFTSRKKIYAWEAILCNWKLCTHKNISKLMTIICTSKTNFSDTWCYTKLLAFENYQCI